MDPKKLKLLGIKEFEYWEVNLHESQFYLGRCVVWCKRKDAVDFFDMTNEEKEEFWEITKKLRDVLMKTFNPIRMNYASLGNTTKHLHLHVMPRFKGKRTFGGVEFSDDGGSYVSSNKLKVSDKLLIKIRDKIKKNWS